jgi:glycosyltransferase involved in cell wall biosynthesis
MRIAQVSPLFERVPPPGYGGIELVVSRLTDELVRRGHEVTLFASGDSETLAHLESVIPQSTRLDPTIKEPLVYDLLQFHRLTELAPSFDIIHCHVGIVAPPFVAMANLPAVHTLHGIFTSDNRQLYSQYRDQAFISISKAQRDPSLSLNYLGNVYNGIDPQDYPFHPHPQNPPYLAFLGRLSPEKGPLEAISIAHATGLRLKMAGKVDVLNQEYYEQKIAPLIDGDQIEYLGELNHAGKVNLIGNAAVTLFPITWPEPFGLVMIESMCTGTPVLGIGLGAVPEVIANGKSGYVCPTLDEMITKLSDTLALNRQNCRDHVLSYFTVTTMVDGYEEIYRQLIKTVGTRPN